MRGIVTRVQQFIMHKEGQHDNLLCDGWDVAKWGELCIFGHWRTAKVDTRDDKASVRKNVTRTNKGSRSNDLLSSILPLQLGTSTHKTVRA